VCRILGKTPSEVGELDPYDIAFLKAGLLWEFDLISKMGGRGLLF